jgi:hypothetical protein
LLQASLDPQLPIASLFILYSHLKNSFTPSRR